MQDRIAGPGRFQHPAVTRPSPGMARRYRALFQSFGVIVDFLIVAI